MAAQELRESDLDQVHVEDLRQARKVDQHVSEFVFEPSPQLGICASQVGLLGCEPLEHFDEFTNLASKRHSEVLGSVESAPVTGVEELIDPSVELAKVGHW